MTTTKKSSGAHLIRELSGGDERAADYYRKVRAELKRLYDRVVRIETETGPRLDAAADRVVKAERRLELAQRELESARAEQQQAMADDGKAAEPYRRFRELARGCPELSRVLFDLDDDDLGEAPPTLPMLARVWKGRTAEFQLPAQWPTSVTEQVELLRSAGVPIPLLVTALRRRRGWLNGRPGPHYQRESRESSEALGALRTWE